MKMLFFPFPFFLMLLLTLELQGSVETLTPRIISKLPHDKMAFTQGLTIFDEELYESAGLYGHSQLSKIDLKTGKVTQKLLLPAFIFAEGLALFKDKIIQLTWREERAIIYQKNPLKKIGEIAYQGEGWGLCRDGEDLWMSDGTPMLTLRTPNDFSVKRNILVTLDEKPLNNLNDLECVGPFLYVNVWKEDKIVKIEKESGKVVALIDCSTLLSKEERGRLHPESILNGIAYHFRSKTFFITGKNWEWLFEVTFE